jgi:methenyltetrahydromethanopterin cyclohydrolase
MNLNQLALGHCGQLLQRPSRYHVAVSCEESGAKLVDCGVHVTGGLEVGCRLAEVCMANLGRVRLAPCNPQIWQGAAVTVATDQPLPACMASQYAGWQIAGEKFFAMGSGPMRAARGREKLFEEIGFRERAEDVVGVLESGKLPPRDVCHHIAEECRVEPDRLLLLVAPTASIAGTIQVVARTVETALHKMHEIGFDLREVVSGFGVAPLPPVAAEDLVGIARTNDAVLYGGEVTLWMTGDDEQLASLGPKIPSCSSVDFGQSFGELFTKYNQDFYKIDPLLFSPAVVNLVNLRSGRSYRFGEYRQDVLRRSFAT